MEFWLSPIRTTYYVEGVVQEQTSGRIAFMPELEITFLFCGLSSWLQSTPLLPTGHFQELRFINQKAYHLARKKLQSHISQANLYPITPSRSPTTLYQSRRLLRTWYCRTSPSVRYHIRLLPNIFGTVKLYKHLKSSWLTK